MFPIRLSMTRLRMLLQCLLIVRFFWWTATFARMRVEKDRIFGGA
jgi:hypothetical protein